MIGWEAPSVGRALCVCKLSLLCWVTFGSILTIVSSSLNTAGTGGYWGNGFPHWYNKKLHLNGVKVYFLCFLNGGTHWRFLPSHPTGWLSQLLVWRGLWTIRVVEFIVAALDDAGREGATVVGPGREIWFEFLKNSNSSFTKLEYSYPIWMVCEGNLATRSATSDEAKLKAIEEMGSPIDIIKKRHKIK